MKCKLFLSFCSIVICNLLPAQPILPNIKTVVERLYSNYDIGTLRNPYVQFQKREEGWYVVTLKGPDTDVQVDSSWFLYSFRRKAFLPLRLSKVRELKNVDYKTIISGFDEMMYEKEPYYGYVGWYKDVIRDLKKNRP